jgi:L-threonylcarbamoyladenylate synthase
MTDQAAIVRAAALLKEGGLVAFPTETVYGLGGDATQDEAVARIYAAKGRPQFNPLIAHVEDAKAAEAQGLFTDAARKLAAAFWPGPLTLVLPRRDSCTVSLLCSAGLPSLALRVPAHPLALALLREVARPIAAPSANRSGKVSPTTAAHVRASLGSAVDMVLDGGPCTVGVESTVVGFLEDQPRLLRPGGLPRATIEDCLGLALASPAEGPLHAPGQLESHYAPHGTLRLNAESPEPGETYLGFGAYASGPHTLSATGNLIEATASLFRKLHELDAVQAAHIAVAPIPMSGLGEAINDRLRRAAAPRS